MSGYGYPNYQPQPPQQPPYPYVGYGAQKENHQQSNTSYQNMTEYPAYHNHHVDQAVLQTKYSRHDDRSHHRAHKKHCPVKNYHDGAYTDQTHEYAHYMQGNTDKAYPCRNSEDGNQKMAVKANTWTEVVIHNESVGSKNTITELKELGNKNNKNFLIYSCSYRHPV